MTRFETEVTKLRSTGKDDHKTRAGIRAKEVRIYKLRQMESAKDWDELLIFVDKELGAQQPQPRLPPVQGMPNSRHAFAGSD
jgi:hypothetical protein